MTLDGSIHAQAHLEFELLVGPGDVEDGVEAEAVSHDEADMASYQHRHCLLYTSPSPRD